MSALQNYYNATSDESFNYGGNKQNPSRTIRTAVRNINTPQLSLNQNRNVNQQQARQPAQVYSAEEIKNKIFGGSKLFASVPGFGGNQSFPKTATKSSFAQPLGASNAPERKIFTRFGVAPQQNPQSNQQKATTNSPQTEVRNQNAAVKPQYQIGDITFGTVNGKRAQIVLTENGWKSLASQNVNQQQFGNEPKTVRKAVNLNQPQQVVQEEYYNEDQSRGVNESVLNIQRQNRIHPVRDVVVNNRGILATTAKGSVREYWISRLGPKSSTDFAQMIEVHVNRLSNPDKVVLLRQYKKIALRNPANNQQAAENYRKGITGILAKRGYNSEAQLTQDDTRIIDNYLEEWVKVGNIGDKLAEYSPKVAWDHIGICLTNDCIEMRSTNLSIIPMTPDFFYSKCYTVGSDFEGATNEVVARFGIVASFMQHLAEETGAQVLTPDLVEDFELRKCSPNIGSLSIYEAMEDFLNNADMGSKLDACYLLDVKNLGQIQEFKTSARTEEGRKMAKTMMEIYFAYILLCDHYLGSNHFDGLGRTRGGLNPENPLGRSYFDALRQLREFIRECKRRAFGYTQSNPRNNREALEDFDESDVEEAFGAALDVLNQFYETSVKLPKETTKQSIPRTQRRNPFQSGRNIQREERIIEEVVESPNQGMEQEEPALQRNRPTLRKTNTNTINRQQTQRRINTSQGKSEQDKISLSQEAPKLYRVTVDGQEVFVDEDNNVVEPLADEFGEYPESENVENVQQEEFVQGPGEETN